jgi:hypothetical protein
MGGSEKGDVINEVNDKLLKKAPSMANVQLTVSYRYLVLEEDNTDEGSITYTAVGDNVAKNNLYVQNQFINREGLKSRIRFLTACNPSEQQETQ